MEETGLLYVEDVAPLKLYGAYPILKSLRGPYIHTDRKIFEVLQVVRNLPVRCEDGSYASYPVSVTWLRGKKFPKLLLKGTQLRELGSSDLIAVLGGDARPVEGAEVVFHVPGLTVLRVAPHGRFRYKRYEYAYSPIPLPVPVI